MRNLFSKDLNTAAVLFLLTDGATKKTIEDDLILT